MGNFGVVPSSSIFNLNPSSWKSTWLRQSKTKPTFSFSLVEVTAPHRVTSDNVCESDYAVGNPAKD